MGKLSRRSTVVGVITAFGLGTGGFALAAWTTGGSGEGYAKAGTAQALTTASAVTTATLYPGATGNVTLKVVNANPYPVSITGVNGSGTITSDAGAACNAATGVTFLDQTGPYTLAAGETKTLTLTGAVTMSNASDTTCQGAVFTIPVTLVGASSAS